MPKGTHGKFKKLVAKLKEKGYVHDPEALAASIERKQIGQAELTRRSVEGRKEAAA